MLVVHSLGTPERADKSRKTYTSLSSIHPFKALDIFAGVARSPCLVYVCWVPVVRCSYRPYGSSMHNLCRSIPYNSRLLVDDRDHETKMRLLLESLEVYTAVYSVVVCSQLANGAYLYANIVLLAARYVQKTPKRPLGE